MKKCIWAVLMGVVLFSWGNLFAGSISITGVVKQPLNLSLDALKGFKTARVQLNEIMKEGSYTGSWFYDGVPLRTLLETAFVEKEESGFPKAIDLAIVVRNSEGKEIALSWGEIFYKNSADVLLATAATPIKPRHKSEDSDGYEKQFDRKIGFPKLVVAADAYADRSIENVVSIEVVNPRPGMGADKSAKMFAPSFTVTGAVTRKLAIDSLSGFPRKNLRVAHMGEGSGYHGSNDYAGVSVHALMEKAGISPKLSSIFLFSAPDGYRSVLSYGELFLGSSGQNMLIADTQNGKNIENGGKFVFVPSGDLMSDRDVKALEKIEVIDLQRKPNVTFIGIGSGDTDLITVEAITAMSRADVFICPPDIQKRFRKDMGDTPVLFDFFEFIPPKLKQKYAELPPQKLNEKMEETWKGIADTIRAEIKKGRSVGLLAYGAPTIWSATEYLRENFDEDSIEIVPGLSSFNVASALLERHTGCRGGMVLATGKGILENKPLYEAAAKNGETLSVFMASKDMQSLIEFFNTIYKPTVPVNIVSRAGYSGNERVVRTDLKGLKDAIQAEKEKDLMILFLGPCLDAASKAHRH